MRDIIWPPAPFKICYLALTWNKLHEPAWPTQWKRALFECWFLLRQTRVISPTCAHVAWGSHWHIGRIRLIKFRHIRYYWLDVSNNFVFDWYRKWSHVRYVRTAGGPSVKNGRWTQRYGVSNVAWRNYHVICLLQRFTQITVYETAAF